MVIVYAARDPRLVRTVALKMIRRATDDPDAAERPRRGSRSMSS